jgi:hypothetical protein
MPMNLINDKYLLLMDDHLDVQTNKQPLNQESMSEMKVPKQNTKLCNLLKLIEPEMSIAAKKSAAVASLNRTVNYHPNSDPIHE